MKTWTVVMGALVLASGCAGKAWRDAKRANTSQAYAAFAANQPEHPKVRVARARAEAIDWAGAQEADDASSYAMFVATHPTSPYVTAARERGEVVAWEEAVEDGSVAALETYLVRFGSGAHGNEARQLIEQAWYDDARVADSISAWSAYLVRYPAGQFVEEARRRRDALGWDATVAAGTPVAYRDYLRQHPRGTHRAEARQWLSELRVHTLQPVLVYRTTWRDPRARARDRARYVEQYEKGLLSELGRDFTLRPTVVEDDEARALPPAQERHGTEVGVGLLELVIDETEGRHFEPSGHATDVAATLKLFVPPTSEPIFQYDVAETTPQTLFGSTVESLYTEAVLEFGGALAGVPFPVERVAPEKPTP